MVLQKGGHKRQNPERVCHFKEPLLLLKATLGLKGIEYTLETGA